MSAGHVFGPDLRRARVKRGIALEEISCRTNVSIDLWAAMERNDFSRWPTGIYARAYVREYARAIGVDPDATVDEFCRSFPQGDRRTERILREQAAIVGHQLAWSDDPLPAPRDDRRSASSRGESTGVRWSMDSRRMRCLAAGIDLTIVALLGWIGAAVVVHHVWTVLTATALLYYSVTVVLFGRTLGVLVVDTYLSARPHVQRKGDAPAFDHSLSGVLATHSGGHTERQASSR
jgi:transcriptional regulator with XRE-family HTH domain